MNTKCILNNSDDVHHHPWTNIIKDAIYYKTNSIIVEQCSRALDSYRVNLILILTSLSKELKNVESEIVQ